LARFADSHAYADPVQQYILELDRGWFRRGPLDVSVLLPKITPGVKGLAASKVHPPNTCYFQMKEYYLNYAVNWKYWRR
jgi:hypothetical protein